MKYTFFKRAVDMGIVYGPKDMTFSEYLLFTWIKEALNG